MPKCPPLLAVSALLLLSLVSSGCTGCQPKPKTLELETRFAGGSWRKNWVVTVSGTNTRGGPLEGPVSLEASCGALTGSHKEGEFKLALGALHVQLSCDSEQQDCCGDPIDLSARAGEVIATGRAVVEQAPKQQEAEVPRRAKLDSPRRAQPDAEAGPAAKRAVLTLDPWGGRKFDPGKVYLFSTLSPPPGHAPTEHAICDLEDPEHPAFSMLWPYWKQRAVTPDGELLYQFETKIQVFESPPLVELEPGRYSIDRKHFGTGTRETPGCSPYKIWVNPETGELTYLCQDERRYFTEDRLSAFQPERGEAIIALGYGGLILMSGRAKTVVVDGDLKRHAIEDWRTFHRKISQVRAVKDGFLFATCTDTNHGDCFLNHLDGAGRITTRGALAPIPKDISVYGEAVLDKVGNTFWIATRAERPKGLVVKLPLQPGEAEIVFDDRDARPCDWSVETPYLHPVIWDGGGGKLVTGP